MLETRGDPGLAKEVAEVAGHPDVPYQDDTILRAFHLLDELAESVDSVGDVEVVIASRLSGEDDAPDGRACALVKLDNPRSVTIMDPFETHRAKLFGRPTVHR